VLRIVATVALPIVIMALVLLALEDSLFSYSSVVITAQLAAVGLLVWARRSFSPGAFRVGANPAGNALLRTGPYRWIRHPMYAAALLLVGSGVFSHLSWLAGAVGVGVAGVIVARITFEERLLRESYPAYAAYSKSTKALVPHVL